MGRLRVRATGKGDRLGTVHIYRRVVLSQRHKCVGCLTLQPGRIGQRDHRNRSALRFRVVHTECHASAARGLRHNVGSGRGWVDDFDGGGQRGVHGVRKCRAIRSRAQRGVYGVDGQVDVYRCQRRFFERDGFGVGANKRAGSLAVSRFRPQLEQGLAGLSNQVRPGHDDLPANNRYARRHSRVCARLRVIIVHFHRAGRGGVRHTEGVRGPRHRHGFGAAHFGRRRVLRVVGVHVGQRQGRAFQLGSGV